MPNKIGVFHFGNADKSQPFGSLLAAIETLVMERGSSHLRDSLIALPEAFNLKQRYEPADSFEFEENTIARLAQLAETHQVAFVAGVIENHVTTAVAPYNSAYLIAPACCCQLSRKVGRDDMATLLYSPWGPDTGTCDHPVAWDHESCIAALICIDAASEPYNSPWKNNHDRHSALREQVAKLACLHTILCVSANSIQLNTLGVADDWPDVHFLLANSWTGYPRASPSVVRARRGKPIICDRQENVLVIEKLSSR